MLTDVSILRVSWGKQQRTRQAHCTMFMRVASGAACLTSAATSAAKRWPRGTGSAKCLLSFSVCVEGGGARHGYSCAKRLQHAAAAEARKVGLESSSRACQGPGAPSASRSETRAIEASRLAPLRIKARTRVGRWGDVRAAACVGGFGRLAEWGAGTRRSQLQVRQQTSQGLPWATVTPGREAAAPLTAAGPGSTPCPAPAERRPAPQTRGSWPEGQ